MLNNSDAADAGHNADQSTIQTDLAEGLRAAAVAWARRGFRVFPCIPGTKKPFWDGWQIMASRDPEVVRGYWTDMSRGGAAYDFNPAYCTDDLVVVDLDYKDDPKIGDIYQNEYLGDFDTLEIESPSGGTHLVYSNPTMDVKTVGRLDGHMMDIRAVGGLALAPGATYKGGVYRVRAERPIIPVNAAIRGSAGRPRDRSNAGGQAVVDLDSPAAIVHATAIARKAPAAHIGSRGSSAYKLAAFMRDAGVSETTCVALLEEHWAPRCLPPFPTEDTDDVEGLETTVNHVYAYAQNAAGVKSAEALLDGVSTSLTPQVASVFPALAPPSAPTSAGVERKPRLRVQTPDEIAARPRPPEIVSGLIAAGSFGTIIGPPKVGKTFIAAMLAFAVATGTSFCGRSTPAGGRRVMYGALEGSAGLGKRILAIRQHTGINEAGKFQIIDGSLSLGEPDSVGELIEIGKQGDPPALIIIDTAARAMPGMEENSAKDYGIVVNACMAIQSALGATVILVGHTGKDISRGSRGSNALTAAIDFGFTVTPKPGGIIVFDNTEMKDFEAAEPVFFELKKVGPSVVAVRSTRRPVIGPDGTVLIKLTRNPRMALDALRNAINAGTKPIPANDDRAGTSVGQINPLAAFADAMRKPGATVEDWRRAFAKLKTGKDSETDSTSSETIRKAFRRGRDDLKIKGLVSIRGNWAELTEEALAATGGAFDDDDDDGDNDDAA